MGVLVNQAWPMSQPIIPTPQEQAYMIARRNGLGKNNNQVQGESRHQHHLHQAQLPLPSPAYAPLLKPADLCFCGTMPGPCCKATLMRRQRELCHEHPTTPTCVPWLKKNMKMKKIKRIIGMGSKANGFHSGLSQNNLAPLLFNPSIHGDHIQVTGGGSVARRMNGFCKAIAFSNRPVRVNEKVCMKLLEVSTNWNGVLRFGFTAKNPTSLKGTTLPRYACPDLSSREGFWAKAFSDLYVRKDAIIFYYFTSNGDVHFGINGEYKGVYFTGIDTRKPLWALVDVYGNTTAIEFVDPRAHLNNSPKSPNGSAYGGSGLCDSFASLALQSPSKPSNYDYSDNVQIYSHRSQSVHYQVTPKGHSSGGYSLQGSPQRNVQGNIYTQLPTPPRLPLPRIPSSSVSGQCQLPQPQTPTPSTSSSAALLSKGEQSPQIQCQPSPQIQIQSRFEPVAAVKQLLVKTEPSVYYSANLNSSQNSQNQDNYCMLAEASANDTYATLVRKAKLEEESNPNAIYAVPKSFSSAPVKEIPNTNWSLECVACCSAEVDSVFYPCGHMSFCFSCSLEYWRNKDRSFCPICRAQISDVIRTYKS